MNDSPRYFVTSRQNYPISGTKDTGYMSYSAAVNARQRVDEKDRRAGKNFTPVKIVLGTLV